MGTRGDTAAFLAVSEQGKGEKTGTTTTQGQTKGLGRLRYQRGKGKPN